MRKISYPANMIAIFLFVSIIFSSCASTTIIQSKPTGAKIFLDGESVGTTPYTHTDTKIVGTLTSIKLEKEGYEPFNTSLARNEEVDVGAIIGGLFVLVPFLWTMKYKPLHTYELTPLVGTQQPTINTPQNNILLKSKADRLRELKQLLDEKIITPAEYDKEKKKILEEGDK